MSRYNDNGNPESSFKNNNDNDIERGLRVDRIAEGIATKLGGRESSWEYYCKVAGKLPEVEIWNNVEQVLSSSNVRNPGGLFNFLCRRSAYRLNIKF